MKFLCTRILYIYIEENGVYVRIIVLVVKLIRGFFCSLNNIDEMDGKFCFCFEINERQTRWNIIYIETRLFEFYFELCY